MSERKLGLGNLIVTLVKWSFGFTILLVWGVIVLFTFPFTSARRMFPVSQKMIRAILFAVGVKVSARGLDGLDPQRGYVYMVNHSSFLDPFVLGASVPQFIVGIEKASNFKIPIYGWMIRWWGNVPIVREKREEAFAAIDEAKQTLTGGVSIALAPEGTRSRDGRVGTFKKGGFHLAIGAQAPIVPVSIVGVHDVNPDRKFRLRTGTVVITYHPPIESDAVAELPGMVERVREQILSVDGLDSVDPSDSHG